MPRINAKELTIVPHYNSDHDAEDELLRGLLRRRRPKEEGQGVLAPRPPAATAPTRNRVALRPQVNNPVVK